MIIMLYEITCHKCGGIFDLDKPPGDSWRCQCQGQGPTPFKRYWIACSKNPRHRYWSNRSEDCKICENEKLPLITVETKDVSVDGKTIKLANEFVQSPPPSEPELTQRYVEAMKLKEDEARNLQLQILAELRKISTKLNTEPEPKELGDK